MEKNFYKLNRITVNSLEALSSLFESDAGRPLKIPEIEEYIGQFPSAQITIKGKICGFAYSKPFAPDILELLNIFVVPEYRNLGLGAALLDDIEEQSSEKYSAIILVNSVLYGSRVKKFATNFYLSQGYDKLLSTSNSNVFGKNL